MVDEGSVRGIAIRIPDEFENLLNERNVTIPLGSFPRGS
jgi:hypothetical protein